MRISTNTIYDLGVSRLSQLQADQAKLQQQISSGKRVLVPSDDPVAASRILQIAQSQSMNAQYAENRQIANTHLAGLDTSLGSITELLTVARTNLVGSAGTLTTEQRTVLSTNLKASLDTLIGHANTKDAFGNYMYAGLQNDAVPFTKIATGATYNGDSNQQLLQVGAERRLAVNASGDNVFQAGGNDIFAAYQDLITILDNPASTNTDVENGVQAALSSFDTAISNVATVRASVGTRLNEIEALNSAGDNRELQYAQALSELQDLDYAEALTELSQQQIILEAAQKSFVQTSGLSLFNFIR